MPRLVGLRLQRGLSRCLIILLRTSSSCADARSEAPACSYSAGPQTFTLLQKLPKSPDSFLLRFALTPGRRWLGDDPMLPTCIKVLANGTDEEGDSMALEKSYSPVSHPATEAAIELLVKTYEPRPGGGVGAYLCGLAVGETMRATLKSKRMMHGDASVSRRWANVGLLAGGTGIAPLLQIVRILLDDAEDRTRMKVLAINRREEDILMRDELDRLAVMHPDRLEITYSLTSPSDSWAGPTGRGSVTMARAALPPPTADGQTMILVCGTDGFVASWAGPVIRGPKKADGSKGPKIQGPLLGLLAEAGYDASEVFKY